MNASNLDNTEYESGKVETNAEMDDIQCSINELSTKVVKLEQRVNDVEKFYLNTIMKLPNSSKSTSTGKDKDMDKHIPSVKRLQQEASRREAAAAKRMHELMRQFGTIFRQITQHKWAWPFMHPVDVEGLGLHDYYEIIKRPMDFSTIKNQMEVKDGTGYKHVREIYADVRLVFENALKYNDEKSDVHTMAKTLLEKFEEKLLQFLPKVCEEEKRREEEDKEAKLRMQLAQETAHAKLARVLHNELREVDMRLEELRGMVVKRCRKMSNVDKRKLGMALSKLSPEDLTKALEIVAKDDPSFSTSSLSIDLDMDAQSEMTLWRLKFFVKDALDVQCKSGSKSEKNDTTDQNAATNPNDVGPPKRKGEICDALAKSTKRRNKKSN